MAATAAEDAILGILESSEEIPDSGKFAATVGIDHNEIVNIIKSLHGFELVDAQDIKREWWVLTDEGKSYTLTGSPEVQLFNAIPPDGISREELQKKLDPMVFKIGCSQAMKNKWVEMGKLLMSRKVQHVEDRVKDLLKRIENGEVLSNAFISGSILVLAQIQHKFISIGNFPMQNNGGRRLGLTLGEIMKIFGVPHCHRIYSW